MTVNGLIRLYVVALMGDAKLMAEQTCHHGAGRVVETFGAGAAIACGQPDEQSPDGLYRLDIKTQCDGDVFAQYAINFDHSLVIMKVAGSMVLLQCFSRVYTMGDWMNGQGRTMGSLTSDFYSPASPSAGNQLAIMNWLAHLKGLDQSFNKYNWDNFNWLISTLFCADGYGKLKQDLAVQLNSRMTLTWHRSAIKPMTGRLF